MDVRDAVEDDAEAMAAIADQPRDVMINLVHDRTVRVAEPVPVEDGPNEDADDEGHELLGFVSFDARQDTVHVTQIDGTDEAIERLLSEPVRFADGEGMAVELLVPEGVDGVASAAREMGFDEQGSGPQFDGASTTRFRLEP